jgi:hypothetical protein
MMKPLLTERHAEGKARVATQFSEAYKGGSSLAGCGPLHRVSTRLNHGSELIRARAWILIPTTP